MFIEHYVLRGITLSETNAKLDKYYTTLLRRMTIDYVEKGRAVTGAYYAALLGRLVEEIRKKRPHLKKKKIIFYDDNAPSYTLNIAQAKMHELCFKSLSHSLHSPDLDPSDYYLLPNLQRWLCGRRCESNEEAKWETEGYFGGFNKSYYLEGIE